MSDELAAAIDELGQVRTQLDLKCFDLNVFATKDSPSVPPPLTDPALADPPPLAAPRCAQGVAAVVSLK